MFSKIDVRKIVADHLDTLRNNATGKIMVSDIFLFFGLPLLPAGFIFLVLDLPLDQGAVGILATSLSIFAALLFNLLLLIYDVVRKVDQNTEDRKGMFLGQIYANISFAILVSIVTLAILLLSYFLLGSAGFLSVASFSVYYLITLFILTLFMILKRVHILLSREFENRD